jgi:hypothetical protein
MQNKLLVVLLISSLAVIAGCAVLSGGRIIASPDTPAGKVKTNFVTFSIKPRTYYEGEFINLDWTIHYPESTRVWNPENINSEARRNLELYDSAGRRWEFAELIRVDPIGEVPSPPLMEIKGGTEVAFDFHLADKSGDWYPWCLPPGKYSLHYPKASPRRDSLTFTIRSAPPEYVGLREHLRHLRAFEFGNQWNRPRKQRHSASHWSRLYGDYEQLPDTGFSIETIRIHAVPFFDLKPGYIYRNEALKTALSILSSRHIQPALDDTASLNLCRQLLRAYADEPQAYSGMVIQWAAELLLTTCPLGRNPIPCCNSPRRRITQLSSKLRTTTSLGTNKSGEEARIT